MNKKILVWMFVTTLLIINLASAGLYDDTTGLYTLDNANISGVSVRDVTGNGNNGTNDGSTTGVIGQFQQAFELDGTDDFINLGSGSAYDLTTSDFSVNLWIDTSTDGASIKPFVGATTNDGWSFYVHNSTKLLGFGVKGVSEVLSTDTLGDFEDDFRMITVTYDQTANEVNFYFNGTADSGNPKSYSSTFSSSKIYAIGGDDDSLFYGGALDEISIWVGTVLTATNITQMVTESFFPDPPPSGINESLEKTFVDRQIGVTTVSSAAFVPILSETFELNNTINYTYFSSTVNFLPSADNELECKIEVNGDSLNSDLMRTNTADQRGSIFVSTDNIELGIGFHTSTLSCRRSSSPGNIQISESVLVGHFLLNNQNVSMNATHVRNTGLILPGSSTFTNVTTMTHTTNNDTVGGDIVRAIVINWGAVYNYNETGSIVTRYDFDGFKECADFIRHGSTDDLGSLGGSCAILNVSANTQINISVSASGSGTLDLNTHIKEFIIDINEINFTSPSPAPAVRSIEEINVSSSNLTQIVNFTIENVNHLSSNMFIKCGVSVQSENGATNASFQIRLSGVSTDETFISNITVQQGESKVLMLEDVFQNLGVGTYFVEGFAACENANCTITGGDIIAYLTDVSPFEPNTFEITAFDNFTLNPITDFDVQFNGAATSDVNGTVTIVTPNETLTLTLSSDNFFNQTIIDHNTSNNINVSMLPFTKIFVVNTGGSTIINFTVNFINNANLSETGTVNSNSSGVAQIPIFNATYLVNVTNVNSAGINYATTSTNLTANPGLENHTFTAFLTNSFNLIILDEVTRALLNGTNVTIELLSSIEASNFTTENGTIFVDALVPSEIEIRYNADGFDQRSFFVFLQNQTSTNITLYLLNDTLSTQVIVKGLDENGIPVEGVIFQVKREYIIGGQVQFDVVEMDNSDFGGEAVFNIQLNDPNYKWLVVRNVTDNEVLFTSNAAEVTSTTLTFFLNILSDPLESFRVVTNLITGQQLVATRPVYDNTTKLWSATFEIPDATIVDTVCLTVDQITNFGFLQVNQTCTTANTATITVGYDNDLLGSLAKLELTTNTKFSDYLLTSNTFSPTSGTIFGDAGVFIGVWIVSTFALAFVSNAALMVVATFIALMSSAVLGIVGMTYLSFISIAITAGILLFSMRK